VLPELQVLEALDQIKFIKTAKIAVFGKTNERIKKFLWFIKREAAYF